MNLWPSRDFLDCLGWTLLHFVWQGVVIAAMLAMALRLLRGRSAGIRYVAGCAALFLMVLAPIATFYSLKQTGEGPAPKFTVTTTAVADGSVVMPPLNSPQQPVLAVAPKPVVYKTTLPELLEASLPWLVGMWVFGVLGAFVPAFCRLAAHSTSSPDRERCDSRCLANQVEGTRPPRRGFAVAAAAAIRRSRILDGYRVVAAGDSAAGELPHGPDARASSSPSSSTNWRTSAGMITSSTCCKAWSRPCCSIIRRFGGYRGASVRQREIAATIWRSEFVGTPRRMRGRWRRWRSCVRRPRNSPSLRAARRCWNAFADSLDSRNAAPSGPHGRLRVLLQFCCLCSLRRRRGTIRRQPRPHPIQQPSMARRIPRLRPISPHKPMLCLLRRRSQACP